MPNHVDLVRRCLDNTAPPDRYEELGVLVFAKEFFSQCQINKSAHIHYRMMMNALGLFNPKLLSRAERQVYITVFRGAAKSTHFSFVLPLYLINMVGGTLAIRQEAVGWEGADIHNYEIFTYKVKPEFIEIFSETHASAERFTMNIRAELETNSYLHSVFGKKTPQNIQDDRSNIWRRDCFTTPEGCVIYGNGSGQQARGALMFGKRPTLAIFDDIYSRKNTLTEETREKLRYWFFAEAMNSIDSIEGKAMLVGTILHEDTVFTDVKKSQFWTGFDYPAINREELEDALKSCVYHPEDKSIVIPDRATAKTMESKYGSLAWAERHSLHYILSMYAEAYEMGRTSYFYQEILNQLSSPDDMKFTEDMVCFADVEVFKESGLTWAKFEWNSYTWCGVYNPLVGIDIAASEKDKSDDTAIVVAGYANVYPQITGYDFMSAQNQHPYKKKGMQVLIVCDAYIGKADIYENHSALLGKKYGVNNITEGFIKRYGVKRVVFEVAGQQALLARDLGRYLREQKLHVIVVEEPATGNKIERIESILLPPFQSNKVTVLPKTRNGYLIWSQLSHLGYAAHEDGADALSNAVKYAQRLNTPDYQVPEKIANRATFRSSQQRDWETM